MTRSMSLGPDAMGGNVADNCRHREHGVPANGLTIRDRGTPTAKVSYPDQSQAYVHITVLVACFCGRMTESQRQSREKLRMTSNSVFDQRLAALVERHKSLLSRKNSIDLAQSNGVVDRYQFPVLTSEHCPLFWRYDFDRSHNPML